MIETVGGMLVSILGLALVILVWVLWFVTCDPENMKRAWDEWRAGR